MIVADVGLESIPENCNDCPYFSDAWCEIDRSSVRKSDGSLIRKGEAGKDSSCPLMEIK